MTPCQETHTSLLFGTGEPGESKSPGSRADKGAFRNRIHMRLPNGLQPHRDHSQADNLQRALQLRVEASRSLPFELRCSPTSAFAASSTVSRSNERRWARSIQRSGSRSVVACSSDLVIAPAQSSSRL